MKYLLTLIFTTATCALFAQWTELTTGTTNHLNAVQFVNENIGFSIGDNGTFLKTADGGENWTVQSLSSAEQFKGMYFVNSGTGFICSNNHLYQTTDGGENFTEMTSMLMTASAPSEPMHQIRIFFNGDVGIITALWAPVTVVALKTDDGGASWSEFTVPVAGTGFGDVNYSIVNSSTVYAVKNDQQYKTDDNGVSWTVVRTLPAYLSPADKGFQIFNTDGQGYAELGGSGFLYMNDDASASTVPPAGMSYPHSFSYLNAGTGYLLKDNQLFTTSDGGMTRELMHTFSAITDNFNKWHLYFVNPALGFVCGRNGKMYKLDGTTSVSRIPVSSPFSIFPNPASHFINLDCDDNVHIQSTQLSDVSGRVIKTFSKGEKVLDIGDVANGIYFLNIQTESGKVSNKILIQ